MADHHRVERPIVVGLIAREGGVAIACGALAITVARGGGVKTAEQAFNMLRRGGTANVIGMIPVGQTINIMGAALLGEKRIQGSMMGSNRFRVDMPRLIDFYQRGKLHLDEMISGRLKLEQINEGFSALAKGGVARNVIVFDQ